MREATLAKIEAVAGARPLQLENLAWPDIEGLLKSGHELLLLPLGATEQHGPHLPVNTDTVIAEAVVGFAAAQAGVAMLPALPITVSLGHTSRWPGTWSLDHETLIAAVRQIASWSVAMGWKRLLFVNAHFGNDASLRVAVDRLRFDFVDRLQVGTINTFKLTPDIWNYFIADGEDLHANRAETDLMLFLAPELVRMDRVQDDPDRTAGTVFSHLVSHTSQNGVTGRPSLATAEQGKRLFVEMGGALADIVTRARVEKASLL